MTVITLQLVSLFFFTSFYSLKLQIIFLVSFVIILCALLTNGCALVAFTLNPVLSDAHLMRIESIHLRRWIGTELNRINCLFMTIRRKPRVSLCLHVVPVHMNVLQLDSRLLFSESKSECTQRT